MMRNSCEQLAEIVTTHFSYLTEQRGLRFVDPRLARGERCVLFMESRNLRVKFYLAPDEFHVQVGSPDAPLVWREEGQPETRWHYLTNVVGYLRADPVVEIHDSDSWRKMTHEHQAREQSASLRDNFEAIERLFRPGAFATHEARYKEYLDRRRAKATQEYHDLARRHSRS